MATFASLRFAEKAAWPETRRTTQNLQAFALVIATSLPIQPATEKLILVFSTLPLNHWRG